MDKTHIHDQKSSENFAHHLVNLRFPYMNLLNTNDDDDDLCSKKKKNIIFFFSRILNEEEDKITSELLKFYNNNQPKLLEEEIDVIAISTQKIVQLKTISKNLNLKYSLYSDYKYELKTALNAPIYLMNGYAYYKNFSILIIDNIITEVHYPVYSF